MCCQKPLSILQLGSSRIKMHPSRPVLPWNRFIRNVYNAQVVHAWNLSLQINPSAHFAFFYCKSMDGGLYIILSPSLLLSFRKCPCLLLSPVLYRITIRRICYLPVFCFRTLFTELTAGFKCPLQADNKTKLDNANTSFFILYFPSSSFYI